MSSFPSRLLVLAAFALVPLCAVAEPTLVPSRRSIALSGRDTAFIDLTPKDGADLNYALAWHHPPIATISFAAHSDRPILLLEEVGHLLEEVSCVVPWHGSNEANINIRFSSEDVLDAAYDAWTAMDEFVLLTLHSGCNNLNERGAWSISDVTLASEPSTITLAARPISMREVGPSFRVRYDYAGVPEWERRGVEKRQIQGLTQTFDTTTNFAYNPGLMDRFPLFPPDPSLNSSVNNSVIQKLNDAGVQLTCVGCGFKSNFTIGMDFIVSLSDNACTTNPTFDCVAVTRADLNLGVVDLELDAALEVFAEKSFTPVQATYPVLSVPAGPRVSVPDLIDIGPSVGLQISFELEIAAELNVTFGAGAQVAKGATASVSLFNSTGFWDPTTSANGWDNTGLKQDPLRLNAGQLNTTSTIGLAPFAEVSFTLLGVGAVVRLSADLPKVVIDADVLLDVNRQCQPLGPNDFESFTAAVLVGAGLQLDAVAALNVDKNIAIGHGAPTSYNHTIFDTEVPLVPTSGSSNAGCFVFVNITSNSSSDEGVPSPTGTLLSAASAVPTWNIPGIESYFKDNGHLPPNVNYTQMAQETTVPDDIKAAVQTAASQQQQSQSQGQGQGQQPQSGAALPHFNVASSFVGLVLPAILLGVLCVY